MRLLQSFLIVHCFFYKHDSIIASILIEFCYYHCILLLIYYYYPEYKIIFDSSKVGNFFKCIECLCNICVFVWCIVQQLLIFCAFKRWNKYFLTITIMSLGAYIISYSRYFRVLNFCPFYLMFPWIVVWYYPLQW